MLKRYRSCYSGPGGLPFTHRRSWSPGSCSPLQLARSLNLCSPASPGGGWQQHRELMSPFARQREQGNTNETKRPPLSTTCTSLQTFPSFLIDCTPQEASRTLSFQAIAPPIASSQKAHRTSASTILSIDSYRSWKPICASSEPLQFLCHRRFPSNSTLHRPGRILLA